MEKIADIFYNFQDGKYGLDYYPSVHVREIDHNE